MTDILDEILAFTEGYKRDAAAAAAAAAAEDEHLRVASHPAALSVPPTAIVGSTLPHQQYFPQQFAPSPRGVQDDLSAFGLIHQPSHSYPTKNELVVGYSNPTDHHQPHQRDTQQPQQHSEDDDDDDDDDDEAAAAVAAAMSTCMSVRPSSDPMPTSRPSSVNHPHVQGRDNTATSSPTMRRADPSGQRPNLSITPAPANIAQMAAYAGHRSSDGMNPSGFNVVQGPWSTGTKRGYGSTVESDRDLISRARGDEADGERPEKRLKGGEMCAVMPPSAKSILERREKAIREGRRKDAKLTDAERRILRRLRNRESAERCRLRRVQQAAQLEKKIESMQVENKKLVAVAEQYEKTIKRLERVIADFSAQQQQSQQHKNL